MSNSAKDIVIKLIQKKDADKVCIRYHYSKKVTQNSQLNFGVFLNDKIEGVLQYGPSIDRKRMAVNLKLPFYDFMEINRIAFSDRLPKFSESRAMGIVHRLIKKQYPNMKAILSFADGTQCGDGAIYRASGFKLIDIKKNKSLVTISKEFSDFCKANGYPYREGQIVADKSLSEHLYKGKVLAGVARQYGAVPLPGYQFKYLYLYDQNLWSNYQTIPFSKIDELGIGMYKGKSKRIEHENNASEFHSEEGGAVPTDALHLIDKPF